MSASAIARDVAAVGAAAGMLAMLLPLPASRWDTARRVAGLGAVVVAWVVAVASLLPSDDARKGLDRLATPVGAAAGLVGVLVALAVFVLLVRLVLGRPWLLYVLLAAALPVRVPLTLGSQQANLLLPLYVVLALGLVAWMWSRLRGGALAVAWPRTPLDLPIAVFVAFELVSQLWTSDTTEGAVKAVFFWIPFVLLYQVVVAWWAQADALRALAFTTMAMAVPVALLAVFQYATREVFWNHRLQQANVYSRFFRSNSIFYDPNILGRYLVLAMIATLAVAWLARRPRTLALLGALLVVYSAGLVVTFSRSSALELMVGIAILAWRAFGWRRTVAVGAVLVVLGGVFAVTMSRQVRNALTSAERLERVSEGRFDLVRGGLDLWEERPVAGGGLGSFATDYEESLSGRERRVTRVLISHNAPVTVLTEGGVVGFTLFLWLLVAAVAVAWRGRRVPDPDGWLVVVMLAMLAGIFVHSLLYSALFEDPYTWVVAAGMATLAAGAGRTVAEEDGAEADALPPGPEPVAA